MQRVNEHLQRRGLARARTACEHTDLGGQSRPHGAKLLWRERDVVALAQLGKVARPIGFAMIADDHARAAGDGAEHLA